MSGADYARIRDPRRTEHYVYRLIGRHGRLLYVGCSMNLRLRLTEHRRNGRFGHLISSVETTGPFTYTEARRIEREAIMRDRPPFNLEWQARDSMNRPIPNRPRRIA